MMNKKTIEDARTKQDLLYECSSLNSKLSNEIVKNEQLQEKNKRLNGAIQAYYILLKLNVEENKQLKEQLQNISNEFLKYNWKESTQEQICNQLKSLYKSIFKESGSDE